MRKKTVKKICPICKGTGVYKLGYGWFIHCPIYCRRCNGTGFVRGE